MKQDQNQQQSHGIIIAVNHLRMFLKILTNKNEIIETVNFEIIIIIISVVVVVIIINFFLKC